MTAPLIRPAERHQLLRNDLAQRPVRGTSKEIDHTPVVLLHLPFSDCAWLLTEIDNDDENVAFGLADLGLGFPELGSVYLPELEALKLGPVQVVHDTGWRTQKPLSWWTREAQSRSSLAKALREHRALTRG